MEEGFNCPWQQHVKDFLHSRATAHLFIDDPFDGPHQKRGLAKSIGNLFATHPPAQDRIARLRQMSM